MSSRIKWLAAFILLVLAAGAFLAWQKRSLSASAAPAEPPLQTATARLGELVVSTTGAGTVIPAAEVNLSFPRGGLLSEVGVQIGDSVQAGQVLARQDDTDARSQVLQYEIALQEAQLQLEMLTGDPSASELATAQASLASAKADLAKLQEQASAEEIAAARENLASAQAALADLLSGPSAEEIAVAKADLETAEIALQKAQADYDKVSWRGNVGELPQAQALQQATIAYEKAKANYELKVQGASDEALAAARAKVAQMQAQLDDLLAEPDPDQLAAAEAKVAQAQAQLDDLLNGADPQEVELKQLAVQKAQNNLDAARKQLEETTLISPVDGIVTAVMAEPGEYVGTGTLISIATGSQPLLEVLLDESDLDKAVVGYEAEVTFDAFPDELFHGHITQVDPSLVTTNGASAVRVEVQLDDYAKSIPLPLGLNATVDIIGGRAQNAVLVPVEALREIETGKYAVFVVENDKPQLRMVEVGLQDFTTAQIISGLEAGEIVTTGVVKTTAGSTAQ